VPSEVTQYALKADLLGAYAVRASAEVGLLELLRGPRTMSDLVLAGLHERALGAVLPYLRSIGVAADDPSGAWQLTEPAERFLTPLMIRAISAGGTGTRIERSGEGLVEALRGGGVPYRLTYGTDLWSDLAGNPGEHAAFHEHLERVTTQIADDIGEFVARTGSRSVVDLGGGRGALASALAARMPETDFTVIDQPSVLDLARRDGQHRRFGNLRLVDGDFLAARPPSADAYLLCQILHDWDDGDASRILRNIRASMRHGARLWVVERSNPHEDEALFAAMNLRMFAMFGAGERGAPEYLRLAAEADLEPTSSADLSQGFQLLEFRTRSREPRS
jgi:ubiquinone/menaquinone biosynthesis C-methylase UbiE